MGAEFNPRHIGPTVRGRLYLRRREWTEYGDTGCWQYVVGIIV